MVQRHGGHKTANTAVCAAMDALCSVNKDNAKLIELAREAQGGVLTHRRVLQSGPPPRERGLTDRRRCFGSFSNGE
jgi:hypothetical protein